jgi:putative acetyltransferase
MTGRFVLRPCHPSDIPDLAEVFREAALRIGSTVYSREQAEAWSQYPDDDEAFARRLSGGLTLVAELDGRVVSFGQLDPVDHVAFLYTAPEWTRRGLGTAIHAELEREAHKAGVTLLRVEASRIARPLFEKLGYDVEEVEISPWKGLGFERFRMRKRLRHDDASDSA